MSADQNVPILAPGHVKENAFTTLEDGRIAIRTGAVLTPVAKLSDDGARRIRGLIRLRDAVRDCLTHADRRGTDESAVLLARRQLNERYDQFVLRFGPVNEPGQRPGVPRRPGLSAAALAGEFRRGNQGRRPRPPSSPSARSTSPRLPARPKPPRMRWCSPSTPRAAWTWSTWKGLLGRPAEAFLPELKGSSTAIRRANL